MKNMALNDQLQKKISEIKESAGYSSADESIRFDSQLYDKFASLVAFYSAKTIEDTRNYINELRIQRMCSLFPYFFSIIPNRFLVKILPKLSLTVPFKINVGEVIRASAVMKKKDSVDLHCENIFDTYLLPFNAQKSVFDYDGKVLSTTIANDNGPFIFNIPDFTLWINYNNDLSNSVYIYTELKKQKKALLTVNYASGQTESFNVRLFFNNQYSIHPNLSAKMLFNSPGFYLNFQVITGKKIDPKRQIKSFVLDIPVLQKMDKYDKRTILHSNYLPLVNIKQAYAQNIKYDKTAESFPIIHPEHDSFFPFFIRKVSYKQKESETIVRPEIFKRNNDAPSYRVASESKLFRHKYKHIYIELPLSVLYTDIDLLADWTQLHETDKVNLKMDFYNKQVGAFDIKIIDYKKFNLDEEFYNIEEVLKLLKLHNRCYFTKNDFNLLFKMLIDEKSDLQLSLNDFIDLEIDTSDNRLKYVLKFKYSNDINHAIIKMIVDGILFFLNNNLDLDANINCTCEFIKTK